MPLLKNETFTDRDLLLDGNEYQHCELVRCRLVYSGGELPKFVHCNFVNCVFALDGPARRTQQYFTLLAYMGAASVTEEFFETIRRDAQEATAMKSSSRENPRG